MPLPSQRAALERQRLLMPQIFDGGGNNVGQSDENSRRRGSISIAQQPAKAAIAPVVEQATPQAPPAPPPASIFDRLHKFATSPFGGYVIVGPVHDAIDGDPFINSGYPMLNAQAATIQLGLGKALLMLSKVKPSERVALIILSSAWTENITIPEARIDLFGIGRPKIYGQFHVTLRGDASLHDIDFHTTDSAIPTVFYEPPVVGPGPFIEVPIGLYGCRIYGGNKALFMQRRFHAEDCQFFQLNQPSFVSETATVRVEAIGPEQGWSDMKNCKIFSWVWNAQLAGANPGLWLSNGWGVRPGGYALHARANVQGTFYIGKLHDEDCWILPSSGLILHECEVFGSTLNEQWLLEFRHCSLTGSVTDGDPLPVGGLFLRSRGHPIMGGHAPALSFFEHCEVRAETIADAALWPGFIAGPGQPSCTTYIAFRQSLPLANWDIPGGQPFMSTGGFGVADIVQSPVAGSTWTLIPNWAVTTYGDCPVNALGLRELYTL